MIKTTLCMVAAVTVIGCGGTTFVNNKYQGHLSGSASTLVIMPVEVHRFPKAMRAALEKQMNDEIGQAFGSAGVKVMPVAGRLFGAGFGNLGWRLALGMYYRSGVKGSSKLAGAYYDWLDDLAEEAGKFSAWIAPALRKVGARAPGDKPRYILAAYLNRFESTKRNKTGEPVLHFRAMVGVFDAQEGRIVGCHWKTLKAAPDLEKIRPLLSGFGAEARRALGPIF